MSDIVELYCNRMMTIQEISDRTGVDLGTAHRVLDDAEVTRSQGARVLRLRAEIVPIALRLRADSVSMSEIGRRLKRDEGTIRRALQQWATISAPWVERAVDMHRSGISWSVIAKKLRRDREDIRDLVSQRIGYERGRRRLEKERRAG